MALIDGRKIAQETLNDLKAAVNKLSFQPVFCDVLVGEDKASAQYVRMKGATAEKIGLKFRSANYASSISQQQLISEIKKISGEPNMCGLIVQLPLPKNLPRQEILDAIPPEIDVDCMSSENLKNFYQGNIKFTPPTAAAILDILGSLNVNLHDKKILVIGQGELVGKPTTSLLKRQGWNVTVADINTLNTDELLKQADVIITATGKAGLVIGDKIKSGAVVIDAGTSELDGGIVGDVDFGSVSKKASFLSPVPGGVGPVTVANLLKNVVSAAQAKI